MISSSKAQTKRGFEAKKGLKGKRSKVGSGGNGWKTVKTVFGGDKKIGGCDVAGKYFWDSHKIGGAHGKILDYSKYFCSCEELNKLIHKQNPTPIEYKVLEDMGRRWKVCSAFANGQRCYIYNCNKKHSWNIEGNMAFRQAALELKFCKKLCRFCKARPGVSEKFARKDDDRKKRRKSTLDTASVAGSTASTSSGSVVKFKRPGNSLYDPKALALNMNPIQEKPNTYKAEEFPSLGAPSAATAVQLNRELKGKKRTASISKKHFEPTKHLDPPIKFSELPGTDLPEPVGAQAIPETQVEVPKGTNTVIEAAPETTTEAPEKPRTAIEESVFSYTETPSQYDPNPNPNDYEPNDCTLESASGTSMANSISNSEIEEPSDSAGLSKEAEAPVATPMTRADPINDTLLMVHAMMKQMTEEMKALRAENAQLRARIYQPCENVQLKARIYQPF